MIFLGKNRKEKGNEKRIHKRDEWNLRKCSEKFIQGGYYMCSGIMLRTMTSIKK
jgi:hypothetical protein